MSLGPSFESDSRAFQRYAAYQPTLTIRACLCGPCPPLGSQPWSSCSLFERLRRTLLTHLRILEYLARPSDLRKYLDEVAWLQI